jgi:hypothetical protein
VRRELPVDPDEPFRCEPLRCVLRRRICVARYLAAQAAPRDPTRPRSLARHDGKRGRAPDFVSCAGCVMGRAVRELLGDSVADGVRNGWRLREDLLAWNAWRARNPDRASIPRIDHPPAQER